MGSIWADIVQYRRAYFLTAVAAFGGMLFGWDTGETLPLRFHDTENYF